MEIKNILLFCGIFFSILAIAQEEKEWEKNDANVEKLIYDVVGTTEIKLNQANRLFDPVPPQSVTRENPELEYQFVNIFYQGSSANVTLRPRRLAATQEEKLYGGYFSAGFGNYVSPLLKAGISNKRDKEFNYGADFLYDHQFRGAVDDENSGQGTLGTNIYAQAYGDKMTIYGNLGFNRRSLHYYGYPDDEVVSRDTIKQHFNTVNFLVGGRNTTNDDDFRYDVKFGVDHQSDFYDAKETRVYTDVNTSIEVIKDIWVEVDGQYNYISRFDQGIDNARNFIDVKGIGRFKKEKFDFYGGLLVNINPDTLAGSKGLHLYPQAGIDLKLSDQFMVFGSLGGGMQLNTWQNVTLQNPFLNSDTYIANTNNKIDLKAGVKGNVANLVSIEAGVSFKQMKNAAFFINNSTDFSRFDYVYDTGEVVVFNPYVKLNLSKNEKVRFGVSFDYYDYQTEKLLDAFHRPTVKTGLFSNINLNDKIYIDTRIGVLGGMKYYDNEIKSLDVIVNAEIDFEYFISNRLSAFLNFDNVISKNYQLFYRYPVPGFRAQGGVTFRF